MHGERSEAEWSREGKRGGKRSSQRHRATGSNSSSAGLRAATPVAEVGLASHVRCTHAASTETNRRAFAASNVDSLPLW